MVPLDERSLSHSAALLAHRDPDLGRIFRDLGPPPLWARPQGFPTLIHIILEQQVSLASARATFERLLAVASPLTPERFLMLDDAALGSIGFSRQKAAYGRNLARAIHDGQLDLDKLANLDDETVRRELVQIKGIGPWTADIYLLMVLLRPDIWPAGDLALATAAQSVKGLENRPDVDELTAIGAAWQPWRAVAARLLWHYYLNR